MYDFYGSCTVNLCMIEMSALILRYKIGSLGACPVLYGSSRDGFSVLPAYGLGEATTWSGLHMLHLNCV